MIELSILRARRQHAADLPAPVPANFYALPFSKNELDAAFLLFAG